YTTLFRSVRGILRSLRSQTARTSGSARTGGGLEKKTAGNAGPTSAGLPQWRRPPAPRRSLPIRPRSPCASPASAYGEKESAFVSERAHPAQLREDPFNGPVVGRARE